jgi:AcrR family transcriptional regulator
MPRRVKPARRTRAAQPSGASKQALAALELRRAPVQARGQATFDRILDSTAELLDEVGLDKLTTNLIAQHSRTNIATLYKYFPNKHAVIVELFRKQAAARRNAAMRHLAELDRAPDWRRQVSAAFEQTLRVRRSQRGEQVLRAAIRSSPDLVSLDREVLEDVAQTLASSLVRAGGLAPRQARTIARCALAAAVALLDLCRDVKPAESTRVMQEVRHLLQGYLAPYLDRA